MPAIRYRVVITLIEPGNASEYATHARRISKKNMKFLMSKYFPDIPIIPEEIIIGVEYEREKLSKDVACKFWYNKISSSGQQYAKFYQSQDGKWGLPKYEINIEGDITEFVDVCLTL